MIEFKDFAPRQLSEGGFLSAAQYASFEDAVNEAGSWIESAKVTVINIETVVLPNMRSRREEGSTDTSLRQSDERSTTWNQFIRVWYQA